MEWIARGRSAFGIYAFMQRSFRLTAWTTPRDRGPLGTRQNGIIHDNQLSSPILANSKEIRIELEA